MIFVAKSGGKLVEGEMGDVIHAIVSPISVPTKMLPVHIKKGAFLVHISKEVPLAFDEEGVLAFLDPLFKMQALGCRNNILVMDTGSTNATWDGLLAWQLFGGISLSIAGGLDNTLAIINNLFNLPLNGNDSNKRAVQMATGLPFSQLEIVDDWGLEKTLIYGMMNKGIPFAANDTNLFNMSDIDREILRGKVNYE